MSVLIKFSSSSLWFILFLLAIYQEVIHCTPMPLPLPYGRPDGHPILTLFEHEHQTGAKYYQDLGDRCYNLPAVFDDKASSLDTSNRCIVVCRERDCKGRCVKMARGTPGHFDLAEVGMNDAISSFSRC